MTTIRLGPTGPSPAVRAAAVRRGRLLNRLTIGWNALEGIVAVAAGLAAGSVSLIGFGLDSGIEVSAALILAWRLAQERGQGCTQDADRRATRAIAVSFFALAAYVGVESTRDLVGRAEPEASIPGIVLAGLSLVVMPLLARAKRRVAPVLGSRAAVSEANQTSLCALLSAVLLVGLVANALLGWWWADPAAGLGIAALAAVAGMRTWRAESLADTCCD
jgi:divalent metal cation (Fe/Co/Zn/Cd) transporter